MDALDILDDQGNLLPMSEWPKIWRLSVTSMETKESYEGRGAERRVIGVIRKIKLADKLKNLELLGKHVAV